MTQLFYYHIYGLYVQSELEITGAMSCDAMEYPDVIVQFGPMPEFLAKPKADGYHTYTNKFSDAWFYHEEVGEFYIDGGKKVILSPLENPNWSLLTSLFLSAGMCLILLQRNEPVFHGSTIVYNNNAIIISGESGAGKSTATFALMKKPYGFLADDTVHISFKDQIFYAEPSYPQQKLCRDMAIKLGYNLNELRYIDEERDKYAVQCSERYITNSVPLKLFVILRAQSNCNEVISRQLCGKEYLDAMIDALYLSTTYKTNVGVSIDFMTKLIQMAKQIQVYEIIRPLKGDSICSVTNEIERLIQLTAACPLEEPN